GRARLAESTPQPYGWQSINRVGRPGARREQAAVGQEVYSALTPMDFGFTANVPQTPSVASHELDCSPLGATPMLASSATRMYVWFPAIGKHRAWRARARA